MAAWSSRSPTPLSLCLQRPEPPNRRRQASIVFLEPARAGDVLIAEAAEEAIVGRSGVYHVSVRSEDGRAIAHFQGFSRSVGGPVIGDEQ